MSLENQSVANVDSERLSSLFAEIGAPTELLQKVIELSQQFGPELLTGVLGFVSIYLINKGSSTYGELNGNVLQQQQQDITQQASEQIAVGAVGMAATAFAAGNPLFAYPEIIAVLGSLKPYLESRYSPVAAISQAIRLDLIVKATAIGVGGFVTYEYAQNAMQALPPMSLTALSIAFSGNLRQEVYRILTLSGGAGLILGSAYAAYEANSTNNTVGTIMSIAFLTLNALFTRNEWNEVQKMGGIQKVLATACQSTWRTVRNLLNGRKNG